MDRVRDFNDLEAMVLQGGWFDKIGGTRRTKITRMILPDQSHKPLNVFLGRFNIMIIYPRTLSGAHHPKGRYLAPTNKKHFFQNSSQAKPWSGRFLKIRQRRRRETKIILMIPSQAPVKRVPTPRPSTQRLIFCTLIQPTRSRCRSEPLIQIVILSVGIY